MKQKITLEGMVIEQFIQAEEQLNHFFEVKDNEKLSKSTFYIIIHYLSRPIRYLCRTIKKICVALWRFIVSAFKKTFLIPINTTIIYKDNKNIVLVRGNWGVGKTTFIKQYFAKNVYVNERYNPIYVDLFGLRNIDELNKKVIESISYSKAKETSEEKNINLYAKATISNKFTGLSASFEIGVNLSKKINKKKSYNQLVEKENAIYHKAKYRFYKEPVIILDDIERKTKELSLETIIGFVDIFKKQGIKVILITNEQQLLLSEKEMYHLLDRVVDYDISLHISKETISSFVQKFQLDYSQKILLGEDLFNLIIDTNYSSNLRTYKKFAKILCDINREFTFLDNFFLNVILLCLINKNEGTFDYNYLIDMLAKKSLSFPDKEGYLQRCEAMDNKFANIKNDPYKVFEYIVDQYIKDRMKVSIKDQDKIIEKIYWCVDRSDDEALSKIQISYVICPLLDFGKRRFTRSDEDIIIRNRTI